MAQPINHDEYSSVATAGGEALKGGLLGAALAWVIPVALAVATVYAAIATAGVSTILGGLGMAALTLASGAATVVSGMAAAGATGFMVGGGALLGMFKGGRQVSAEQQAFRDRVQQNMEGRQNKMARAHNDGEIAGMQQGYQIGRGDGEQVGFQKGQAYVVEQLQQHAAAMQEAASQPQGGFAGKLKASCKCESKVEMVDKQRAEAAAAVAQIGG